MGMGFRSVQVCGPQLTLSEIRSYNRRLNNNFAVTFRTDCGRFSRRVEMLKSVQLKIDNEILNTKLYLGEIKTIFISTFVVYKKTVAEIIRTL